MEDSKTNVNNLYRIAKESHIDQILAAKRNKLIMTIFSHDNPKIKIFLKKHLAQQFPDCFFILAIVDNNPDCIKFVADTGNFVKELKGKQLPFVFFHYNSNSVGTIQAAESSTIFDALRKLKSIAETSYADAQNNTNNNQNVQNVQNDQNNTNNNQNNQNVQDVNQNQQNNQNVQNINQNINPNINQNPNQTAQLNIQLQQQQQYIQQQQQARMAHDHVIERMAQQKHLHDCEELERLAKMKENKEKYSESDKKDSKNDKKEKKRKDVSSDN